MLFLLQYSTHRPCLQPSRPRNRPPLCQMEKARAVLTPGGLYNVLFILAKRYPGFRLEGVDLARKTSPASCGTPTAHGTTPSSAVISTALRSRLRGDVPETARFTRYASPTAHARPALRLWAKYSSSVASAILVTENGRSCGKINHVSSSVLRSRQSFCLKR